MTGPIAHREFNLSRAETANPTDRLKQLQSFLDESGQGRLRQKTSDSGEMILYVAPKRPRVLEFLSRLWNRRQEKTITLALQNFFQKALPSHLQDRATYLGRQTGASHLGTTLKAVTSTERVGANGRFTPMERFAGQDGEHTGGKTGSKKVKDGGISFQRKGDVSTASALREWGERGLNVQLLGEITGSAILAAEQAAAEALALAGNTADVDVGAVMQEAVEPMGATLKKLLDEDPAFAAEQADVAGAAAKAGLEFSDDQSWALSTKFPRTSDASAALSPPLQRAPRVHLLNETHGSGIGVASEYLRGGKGDLEQYIGKLGCPIPEGTHVKVVIGSADVPPGTSNIVPSKDKPEVLIQGKAVQDLLEHLANTQFFRDDDFNPAKFIVIEHGGELRLGCIDTAHSFGNLVGGRGNGWAWLSELVRGSGGRRSSDNDFIQGANRKFLRGNSLKDGGGVSKLWRDYIRLIPSQGYAEALHKLAQRTGAHTQGLNAAKGQIASLVEHLQAEGTSTSRAKLHKLLKSLVQMARHDHHVVEMSGRPPLDVVDEVFAKLDAGLAERRKQAKFAGDICALQAATNAYAREGSGTLDRLQQMRQQIDNEHGDVLSRPLVWFAEAADRSPFKGSFDELLAARVRSAPAGAGTSPAAAAPDVSQAPVRRPSALPLDLLEVPLIDEQADRQAQLIAARSLERAHRVVVDVADSPLNKSVPPA